ncbi:MAG: hypothetical protein ACOYL7_06260, partial [Caldilinea sp.]
MSRHNAIRMWTGWMLASGLAWTLAGCGGMGAQATPLPTRTPLPTFTPTMAAAALGLVGIIALVAAATL